MVDLTKPVYEFLDKNAWVYRSRRPCKVQIQPDNITSLVMKEFGVGYDSAKALIQDWIYQRKEATW
jgi:hypothetical protein